jgi:aquaporin Z
MKPSIFFAECVGTFALVFIGAGVAAQNIVGLFGVALTFALVIATMIYLFGEISGTHINPAVTFALALNGNVKWMDAVFYWVAQFMGSIIASAMLLLVFGGAQNGLGATVLSKNIGWLQGLVVEAVGTFFLVNAVFFASVRGYAGKHTGLVLGATIIMLILFAGPLTGAGFNPARSFGPAVFSSTLGQFWIYLFGPLAGATLAVLFYRIMDTKK